MDRIVSRKDTHIKSCKTNQITMTKKQTNSWEEEFDNKFLGTSVDFPYGTMFGDLYLSKEIKNFISKTISQEKEKMIEEIKAMKGVMLADLYSMPDDDDLLLKSEIINLLQNK